MNLSLPEQVPVSWAATDLSIEPFVEPAPGTPMFDSEPLSAEDEEFLKRYIDTYRRGK